MTFHSGVASIYRFQWILNNQLKFQKLIEVFNFHGQDSRLHVESQKIDPRRVAGSKQTDLVITLLFACKNGDFEAVRRLYVQGENLNVVDYDGRSALHLAASEGHIDIIKFLLACNVDVSLRDRWGRTALDDAQNFCHPTCVALLTRAMNRPLRHINKSMSLSNSSHKMDVPLIVNETASSTSDEDAGGVMLLDKNNDEDLSMRIGDISLGDQIKFY